MTGPALFNIENQVLRARSEFNGFAGKDCELFWSTGVLECWQKLKPEFQRELVLSLLHHSITPAACRKMGKTIEAPSGGSPKSGPLGPDSLLFAKYGVKLNRKFP
jgi:hypothetical protein